MLGNLPLDIITGGGSFLLSSIVGGIAKKIGIGGNQNKAMFDTFKSLAATPKTEEDKARDHELKLKEIEWKDKQSGRTYDDLKSARGMTSKFVGVTRRGLAWTVPGFIIAIVVVGIISIYKGFPAVSVPISSNHSLLFGLISWTSHSVQEMKGLYIPGWFQTWVFMVGGFYFGREATK